jgi:hypothetical protein
MLQFIEPFSSLSCLLCSSAMHIAMCLLCPERLSDSGFTWALHLTPFTCRRHAHCTRRYDYRRFSPSAFAKYFLKTLELNQSNLNEFPDRRWGGSAIVSYSPGVFGGINAAQHLRNIFAELGAPTIPSSLSVPRVHTVFSKGGILLDEAFENRFLRFVKEFEWFIEALKNHQLKVYHIDNHKPEIMWSC